MKVIQKNLLGEKIQLFNSITHASKMLKFKREIILKCCTGKQQSTKGFIFNYAN
jgi:hypothetical protein